MEFMLLFILFVSYYKFIAKVQSKNVSVQPIPEPWQRDEVKIPVYF